MLALENVCAYHGVMSAHTIGKPEVSVEIIPTEQRSEELLGLLADIWQRSVEATHDFLDPAQIARLRPTMPRILENAEYLVVRRDGRGGVAAFMTVNGDEIDMLFAEPRLRGLGIGRELVSYATERLGARTVTVHEGNVRARGFYEHMGFSAIGVSEEDWGGSSQRVVRMALADPTEKTATDGLATMAHIRTLTEELPWKR